MKYIDLIAYPIMLGVVYVLFSIANWCADPALWDHMDRAIWILWGLAWGWALQRRIIRGGHA